MQYRFFIYKSRNQKLFSPESIVYTSEWIGDDKTARKLAEEKRAELGSWEHDVFWNIK